MAKSLKKSTEDHLDEIIKMLDGVQKQHAEDFNKLERRLITFEESMDFNNKQYESQKKISENLMKHNSALESENRELRHNL